LSENGLEIETFGERLARLRKAAGVSQATLAEAVGVSEGTVSKWERDEMTPRFDKIAAAARKIGVSVDQLLPPDENDVSRETGSSDLEFIQEVVAASPEDRRRLRLLWDVLKGRA
jgi:transcriptional regulator with XRE-family HTH domain